MLFFVFSRRGVAWCLLLLLLCLSVLVEIINQVSKSFPLIRGYNVGVLHGTNRPWGNLGSVLQRTPPWADIQTFTVLDSHGHLPAGHGTLKREQKTGRRRKKRQSRPVDSESKRSIGKVNDRDTSRARSSTKRHAMNSTRLAKLSFALTENSTD